MVISSLLGFCVAFTLFFGKNFIYRKAESEGAKNYKGIINVWQIDSFEGGTGSRKNFLSDVARTFEKKNDGVLVMVSLSSAIMLFKSWMQLISISSTTLSLIEQ